MWIPYDALAGASAGVLAATVAISACAPDDDRSLEASSERPVGATAQSVERATAAYDISNAEGEVVGRLTLTDGAGGVLVEVEIDGLEPGEHGFHLHETGRCEPPFESAGGHYAPSGRAHGLLSDDGPHAGDLPNLVVANGGTTTVAHAWANGLTIDELTAGDGSALVIHAGPDDYRTDPAGAAGDRVACAEITRG